MLRPRLIACFDVIADRVTKAVQFEDNIDVDDVVSLARRVYHDGIDEVIYYDIRASAERRGPDLETLRRVAEQVFVPLTIGGGIKSVSDMHDILEAGAEKVSVDSMAVRDPQILSEGSAEFGRQCIVLSMQVKKVPVSPTIPSGYEIAIDGAKVFTGMDAVEWARRGESLGAGEIVVNSIDNDGTGQGFDLDISRRVTEAVRVPVIVSGGAGSAQHVADAFMTAQASAAIISSMIYSPRSALHFDVRELKETLRSDHGLNPRVPC